MAYNNALERTRRVGVPASRAIVGVPPCRSTRCSVGLRMRAGATAAWSSVAAYRPNATAQKIRLEKGPQPEKGGGTLMKLACRYDAVRRRHHGPLKQRLLRAASDRQAHRFGTRPPISRGSGAPFPGACSGQGHHASALPAQEGVANGTPCSPGCGRRRSRSEEQRVANITRPPNNAMHQTRRGGVPASRAVVEARLAGDCECSPDAGPRFRSASSLQCIESH